ncbi:MAG: flavin reductase [Candidatus Hodarchaeales archaeon]|jgi:flavin reductase (DIM6/NTAB) family NADH-FMN oxidoreductase RutF
MNEQLVTSRKSISNLLVPYPTILVTQNGEGKYNPTTMSYVSAIHWDPPSIVLSIGRNLKSSENLEENPYFTICIMRNNPKSIEIANKVGTSSGKKEDKLQLIEILNIKNVNISEKWPPAIKGAIFVLHGMITKKIEYHDQYLYIGEILGSKLTESLHMLDEYDKSKLWGALDEIALTHANIYEEVD